MRTAASDVVFLNINAQGQLLVVGRPQPFAGDEEINGYLQTIAADARQRKPLANESTRVDTLVIVRADRDVPYAGIYKVLQQCQQAGLHNLQLRAIVPLRGS